MKNINAMILIFIMLLLSSCGVNEEEYNRLKSELQQLQVKFIQLETENEKLRKDLDDYLHGEERINAIVEKAYKEKNYEKAKLSINTLKERHPESNNIPKFEKLLIQIEKEVIEEQKRIEAEEKERIRLENLNNTGIWTVSNFIDKFGNVTKEKYITNSSPFVGTFSNSATNNSKLHADLIITNSKELIIAIQLYEYGGSNPVKTSRFKYYTINVLDNDGKEYKLKGSITYDRIKIINFEYDYDKSKSQYNATNLHKILKKGGLIKFVLYPDDYTSSIYKFEIDNAEYYENAYRILNEN